MFIAVLLSKRRAKHVACKPRGTSFLIALQCRPHMEADRTIDAASVAALATVLTMSVVPTQSQRDVSLAYHGVARRLWHGCKQCGWQREVHEQRIERANVPVVDIIGQVGLQVSDNQTN